MRPRPSRVAPGRWLLAAALLATCAMLPVQRAAAQTPIRVGWCARTLSAAAAPFAIATRMGWFAEAGIAVTLVPLPGGSDCVKQVAGGDLPYALASVAPLAALGPQVGPQGGTARGFYTAAQGFIFGIAVPMQSRIGRLADLRGTRVGVTSMASAGVIVARALARSAGMDPDRELSLQVVGEGAQTASLLRLGQVDALSQFDAQYALVENAGIRLRAVEPERTARFPGEGFVALEGRLASHRAEAVALARGYAMGTVFALANPQAAVRILWEVFPQTRAAGRDEAMALRDDVKTLQARARAWALDAGGVSRWGESRTAAYQDYLDFLHANGALPERADASRLVTNDLVTDINRFDAAAVAAQAAAYR